MRVGFFSGYGQAVALMACCFFIPAMSGCRGSSEELSVVPPVTNPLTREYIGYGVVNGSFPHLLSEPGSGGVSKGYVRRGTVVRIIERRSIVNRGSSESWVLVEGNYEGNSDSAGISNSAEINDSVGINDSTGSGGLIQGWIQEAMVQIYDNESRAKTASKAMNP